MGFLHLSNGVIDGKQVVHPEIIKLVTTLQSPKEQKDDLPKNGFLWQAQGVPLMNSEIGLTVPKGSYQILGACNQTLLVIPQVNLVVVRMLNRYDSPPGFNYLEDVKSFGDCVTAAAINLFHKLEF